PKDRLVAFLNAQGQPFISDPSNANAAFERSRVRRGEISRAAGQSDLFAETRRLGGLRAAREHVLDAALAQSSSLHPAGFAVVDVASMPAIPNEVVERMLNAIVATIGGGYYPVRREAIARLRAWLGAAPRGAYTLGGCRFVHWRSRLLVMRELARAEKPARLSPGERVV